MGSRISPLLLSALASALALSLILPPSQAQPVNGKKELSAALAELDKAGEYKTFLALFQLSGFESVVSRYIQTQPVSILAPTDSAFNLLSFRDRSKLTGPALIKLVESHMILNQLSFDFIRTVPLGATFRTVYGTQMKRQSLGSARTDPNTASFGSSTFGKGASLLTIQKGDIAKGLFTVNIHGVDRVNFDQKTLRP